MYLLDTHHCSKFLNNDPQIVERLRNIDDGIVATCVIVQGELVFMAQRSARRNENLEVVRDLISSMEVLEIDARTADTYASLKNSLLDRFGPRNRRDRRNFELRTLGFTDNDLWIVACAERYGYTAVSGDSDFSRISQVASCNVENWCDGNEA